MRSKFACIAIALSLGLCSAGTAAAPATTSPTTAPTGEVAVGPVPAAARTRLALAPFYAQYAEAKGLPIVASARVNPYALREAAYLVDQMLAHRPDVRQAMIDAKIRLTVMAFDERTTDVPEHRMLEPKEYWDRRARGLGATPESPCVSCGEENLLGMRGDPYETENILIHEFGHAVHEAGAAVVDRTFNDRLEKAYAAAKAEGLWSKTYAMTNPAEYWAEGTQSWFDCNRRNDAVHNDVDTRDKVKAYDPRLAGLLAEVYGDRDWRYTRPAVRMDAAHLRGLDRASLPTFAWGATTMPATRP